MRAMPSPTSRTRPTSRDSTSRPNCEICSRRTETISPGLNLITTSLDQLVPDRIESSADAGVIQPVPDLHDHPAQKVGIDPQFQDGLALECLPQFAAQSLLMVVVQRHCRADLDAHLSRVLFQQLTVSSDDHCQKVEPVMVIQYQDEVGHQVADAPTQGRAEGLRLAFAADGNAGEEGP